MGTKKKATTAAAMLRRLEKAAPSEWTVATGVGYHDGTQQWGDTSVMWATFRRDGVTIALNVTKATSSWDRKQAIEGLLVEGHTCFDGRCFTRHGVDTSSCRLTGKPSEWDEHTYTDLAALLSGEYARCLAARERAATSVAVPGLPFRVQPEWFAKAAETLRKGKLVTLTPAGFGTGYTLGLGKGLSRYGKRATLELEKALGVVGPVYVSMFDND